MRKRAPRTWKRAQRGRQDAIELQHRPFVEHHGVQAVGFDPGGSEAPLDRTQREARVVLAAREPFLLNGGDGHAIDDEGGRGVVIVGRDAEDRHGQYWDRGERSPCVRSIETKPAGSCRSARRANHTNGGSATK